MCLIIIFILSATIGYGENSAPLISLPASSLEREGDFQLLVRPVCEDDGLPVGGEKYATWQILSAPDQAEEVAIDKQKGEEFLLEFSTPGQYSLRFICSDGELEASRDLYVTVNSEGITRYRAHQVSLQAYKEARQEWKTIESEYFTDGKVQPEYLGVDQSYFTLTEDSEVIVTLLYDGASYRNSLCWYDLSQAERGGITIWKDVATGPNAPLEQGSKASLGLLPKGTQLRFYLIQEGAGVGTEVISQVAEDNYNQRVMVASKFPTNRDNVCVMAFEDNLQGSDWGDVIIMIEKIELGSDEAQADGVLVGQKGLESDRGSRGVMAALSAQFTKDYYESVSGVYQMPFKNVTYHLKMRDDRSPMKFVLGVLPLDDVKPVAPSSLLFREQAALNSVTLMDDRAYNVGDTVLFRPRDYGLEGKRVVFMLIPNNTVSTFLRNAWRYTPRGNGDNTKRQPLFSLPEANPGGLDQFFAFHAENESLLTIEDRARVEVVDELGEASDSSFDDVQIVVSPALVPINRHEGYYGSTIDYSVGYESNDGLKGALLGYDEKAIMKNAKGTRMWDLLFSTLTQPDGAYLVSEFGESLPISEQGAVSVNKEYELGNREDYFIEQQRYGADVIEAGIILNDADLIDQGILMINWGMERQASDGSFPGTGDAVHSVSLFMEAASRAAIALQHYRSRTYRTVISEWKRRVHTMAYWFVQADDHGMDVNLEPFSHRYFLRAAALQQASRITRDKRLRVYAAEYAAAGVALMEAGGVFPEIGEYDPSYQMVGMTFASRYFATCEDEEIKMQVAQVMWQGISCFTQGVQESGEVLLPETCRTATESSRSGSPKRFDFKHATKALVFAEEGLLMEGATATAESILLYYDVLDEAQ